MKRFPFNSRRMITAAAFAGACLVASVCPAAVFTGSGNILDKNGRLVSAQADFSISGNTLTIVLQNTTSGGTLLRGDLLTGIAFDLSAPRPTSLNLSTIALTSGSDIFTSKTTLNNSTALAGSWTDKLGSSPISQYGIAATGFSGAFSAAGLAVGKGGEDYSIAAAGTFPAPLGIGISDSFNGSAFPLIQNSLTFNFGFQGSLSESQLRNVKFLFGTSGADVISTVPEPSTLVIWSALTCLGLGVGLKRRKQTLGAASRRS
jgi:hypothetical protein